MVNRLCLSVPAYEGPDSWRWTLRDQDGNFVGDYEVNLNTTDWQRAALRDLRGYLAANSGGSRERETRIVADVCDWIGERILGPLGPKIRSASPAVVMVTIPDSADELALVPLECARVSGHPLRLRGVTLVTVPTEADAAEVSADEIDDKLRVLAIFQSHPGDPGLNQRKERLALDDMMKKIRETWTKAVEFRALQYGITSQDLRDALEDDPGWDVVHVSGYAAPGLLRLARNQRGLAGGEPEDLVDVLDVVRGRLKLVTVSACVSSGAIAAQAMEMPGRLASGRPPPVGEEWPRNGLPLLKNLAERLGCAVASVRFPVPDDFAFDYFRALYWRLIGRRQPLTRAVELVLSDFHSNQSELGFSALSLTAPVLLGPRVADLQLAAPDGALQEFNPENLKMASFVDISAPERFVGRDDVMREASGALANGSGKSGVLLYGMPGAGKTACAVELAYTRDSLDFDNTFPVMIWCQITSDPEGNIKNALRQFANVLDSELGSFPLSSVMDDEEKLKAHLPKMTEYFKQKRVLVVLDNIETLLDERGGWRDGRWGLVIGALTNHSEFGRVLVTTRQVPAVLDRRVLTLPIGPLEHDDALLLARDLGSLRGLLDGNAPGMEADEARKLGSRVLSATRGHPKLLQLANAAVGNIAHLEELLGAAAEVWPTAATGSTGSADGGEQGEGAEYVRVLERWARTIIASLTPEARAFFQILCCMDEADRVVPVIADNWAGLSALIYPDDVLPSFGELAALLRDRGLVTTEADAGSAVSSVQVHPVLADQGRKGVSDAARLAIDVQLAGYWTRRAVAGDTLAGLSASSYLFRLDEHGSAQQVLEQVLHADAPWSERDVLIAIERAMLRRAYELSDVSRIAERHRRLSAHLAQAGEYRHGLAHLLAAALLNACSASDDHDPGVRSAILELYASCGGTIPGSLAQLSAELEVEGTAFTSLAVNSLGGLSRVERLLSSIVAGVRAVLRPEEDP